MTIVRIAVVAAIFFAVAFAALGEDEPTYTGFEDPVGDTSSQSGCLWGWTWDYWTPDVDEDPWSCPECDSDYYVVTEASGMQVAALAYGEETMDHVVGVGSTQSSACNGYVRVYAVSVTSPRIQIDWKPYFHLKSTVSNEPGMSHAGAYFTGNCSELSVDVNGAHHVATRSSTKYTTAGITLPGGAGGSVPVAYTTPANPGNKTISVYKQASKDIPTATATFSCGVNAGVTLDGSFWDESAAEAWVYESAAGIDLYGYCKTCGDWGFVLYSWYYGGHP